MKDTNEDRDIIGEVIAENSESRSSQLIGFVNAIGQAREINSCFDRLDLELTNSQLRQQLADVSHERDLLQEQVRQLNSEGRTIKLSGCEIKEADLIWGVMHNLHGNRRNTLPRWALVRDVFATGSGVAKALCHRFELNPEEVLKS